MAELTIALQNPEQVRAFENAMKAVDVDDQQDFVDTHRNDRGPNAGDVSYGEVVRVIAESYTGAVFDEDGGST